MLLVKASYVDFFLLYLFYRYLGAVVSITISAGYYHTICNGSVGPS